MSDVDKEWNRLVLEHEEAVRTYGDARSEDTRAMIEFKQAQERMARCENAVMVKRAEVERTLGALLKHAAATGRA